MIRLNGMKKDIALLGLALLIGVQIPSSIEKIGNPTVKVLIQILAVLTFFLVVFRVNPRAFGSVRPPPPSRNGLGSSTLRAPPPDPPDESDPPPSPPPRRRSRHG